MLEIDVLNYRNCVKYVVINANEIVHRYVDNELISCREVNVELKIANANLNYVHFFML